MNAKLFRERVISLLPDVEVVNEYKQTHIEIDENWEMFFYWWGGNTFERPMVEVQIIYRFPLTKGNRRTRKDFRIFCYKYKDTEWNIKDVFRMW
jgi:hypothetical protein